MVTDMRDALRKDDWNNLRTSKTELLYSGTAFTAQTPQEITPANTPFKVTDLAVFLADYVSGSLNEIRVYRKATTPVWAADTPIVRTTYDNRMLLYLSESDLSSTNLWIAFSAGCTATVDVNYKY